MKNSKFAVKFVHEILSVVVSVMLNLLNEYLKIIKNRQKIHIRL